MRNTKMLVFIAIVFLTVAATSQLGDASKGNPFHKILEKLDLVVQLLEQEVIPQLGCEPIFGIPRTGQTTLYSPGDDGDLQMGIQKPNPRFSDNQDGTVTDNFTGLVWLKNANCDGRKTWFDAVAFSNNLADGNCGLTDGSTPGSWRLPNRNELVSLFDYGRFGPALPAQHPFDSVQGGPGNRYWSSTTYIPRPNEAWYIEMYNGVVDATGKEYDTFLLPVRGGNL